MWVGHHLRLRSGQALSDAFECEGQVVLALGELDQAGSGLAAASEERTGGLAREGRGILGSRHASRAWIP